MKNVVYFIVRPEILVLDIYRCGMHYTDEYDSFLVIAYDEREARKLIEDKFEIKDWRLWEIIRIGLSDLDSEIIMSSWSGNR